MLFTQRTDRQSRKSLLSVLFPQPVNYRLLQSIFYRVLLFCQITLGLNGSFYLPPTSLPSPVPFSACAAFRHPSASNHSVSDAHSATLSLSLPYAYELLLQAASNDLIVFLHPDMFLLPDIEVDLSVAVHSLEKEDGNWGIAGLAGTPHPHSQYRYIFLFLSLTALLCFAWQLSSLVLVLCRFSLSSDGYPQPLFLRETTGAAVSSFSFSLLFFLVLLLILLLLFLLLLSVLRFLFHSCLFSWFFLFLFPFLFPSFSFCSLFVRFYSIFSAPFCFFLCFPSCSSSYSLLVVTFSLSLPTLELFPVSFFLVNLFAHLGFFSFSFLF